MQMASLEDIADAAQTGYNIYQGVSGSNVQSGGRVDCRGRRWCSGRPEDWQIAAVLMQATDTELQPIIIGWPGSGRPGATTTPLRQADPCEVGYWLWGHADCKHSGATGNTQKARMETLVAKYAGTALTTGGSGVQTPNTYNPPAPNVGGTPTATNVATQSTGGSNPLRDIVDGVVNFFKGILGGAATGAASAAQAGGTASQASAGGLFTFALFGLLIFFLLRK